MLVRGDAHPLPPSFGACVSLLPDRRHRRRCGDEKQRMNFHYFAYGSNMLPARLSARCRSARVVGKGIAQDFALEFSKPSKDNSGKATLVNAQGATVPGVVYEIEAAERDALDRHEGLGSGYRRDDNFVVEGVFPNVQFSTCTYL